MLSNRNKLFATNNKQRWSIRKLTIGVVSVLFGTTIVFINSTNTVFSDQLDSKTENISKATELISDDNTARTVGEETSSDLPETATGETVGLVNDNTVEAQNEDSTLTETSDPEETQVITPENEDDTLKASLTLNQIQAQSSGSQYQQKESDERKEESSGATYSYYKILREVTIVKPDGQEEVRPYQALDYSDEAQNNQKLRFEALGAPPIAGYNPPVIPAISISIAEFIAKYLNDEITITDVTYDGQPIQGQIVSVGRLPDGPKYDDDFDRLYEEFCEEYKDKYDLRDVNFDVLLIKEKYFYIGKEEKTITRTINVHLPSGEVQTTKYPVTLERTYTSVAGSDQKNYGPWSTGRWESFTAPELVGYTALPASVDAVEVTSESLDAVVDIYYRADVPVLPATPVDPTDPSTPTNPVTPTDPSTPTNPVDPTDPSTPTNPVDPTDPSTPTNPVDPTDPSTPTINVKNNISNKLASGSKVEDEVEDTTDSQEKLPQTGNKSSVIYSIFGLILTSLLGVWTIIRKH